jgi:hypothetical protein
MIKYFIFFRNSLHGVSASVVIIELVIIPDKLLFDCWVISLLSCSSSSLVVFEIVWKIVCLFIELSGLFFDDNDIRFEFFVLNFAIVWVSVDKLLRAKKTCRLRIIV